MKPVVRLLLAATLAAWMTGAQAQGLLQVWQGAAQHDRQLAVDRAGHGASEALRDQAEALWRPQVGLSVTAGLGASNTAIRGARFSAPAMGTVDGARFGTSVNGGLATNVALVAQQPLINPARSAQQEQLRLSADMGDTAWHAAHDALMLQTAERYFAVALADDRVRVLAQQADALQRASAEAHDRYKLGAAPVTDTYEADAALARVRAEQSAAGLDASVQQQQLASSTGLARILARLPMRQLPAPGLLRDWQQAAQDNNLRLQMLEQAVGAAEQRLRERGAAGRPTLDLVASAGHERIAGSGSYGSARNRDVNAVVGVRLNIPLATGGMASAQEREAAAGLEKARAELDLARDETARQVQAAWMGLQAAAARIAALEQGIAASTARLEATRLGREVGDRTTLDLLNAENDLAQAHLALSQARSEQVLTHLRLAALAGRLDETALARVDGVLAPEPANGGAR